MKRRRGFSLLEVMIAVGILATLAGIGWGSVQTHLPRFRLVRVAKQFRADLVEMRQISVQMNRESKILLLENGGDCSNPNIWGGAWEMSIGNQAFGSTTWDLLPEDSIVDGADDDQTLALRDFTMQGDEEGQDICFRQWPTLRGTSIGGNNSDSIVFSPRGWLRNPSQDFNARGYIEFMFVNQEAQRNGFLDAIRVQVTRAGMIRLFRAPANYNLNQVGTSEASSVQ